MDVFEIVKKYYSRDFETYLIRAKHLKEEIDRIRNLISNPSFSSEIIITVEDINNLFKEFNSKYSEIMKKAKIEKFKTFKIDNFNIYYLMKLFDEISNELKRFSETIKRFLE